MAWAEAYLPTKWHLDPSNCLATIHQRHREDRQSGRQRSNSIERTVLQTFAQKSRPNFRKFSARVWPSSDDNATLRTSGFVDDVNVMFAHNQSARQRSAKEMPKEYMKVTHQGQHRRQSLMSTIALFFL